MVRDVSTNVPFGFDLVARVDVHAQLHSFLENFAQGSRKYFIYHGQMVKEEDKVAHVRLETENAHGGYELMYAAECVHDCKNFI